MSKKHRRRAAQTSTKTKKLSPEALERQAQAHLTARRHRDAIAAFKQLLKLEPRPEWRAGLAEAYAGRARELTGKGMVKEALVIWENRAALGEDIGFEPDHGALLMRMGRVDSASVLLRDEAAIPPAERARLRSLLAARYLAGDAGILERLPADDPVVSHAEPARAALAAYSAGDDEALQAALATLPFRSPYRDWVQILKALQRLPERRDETAGLLARIGEDSAFAPLRRAAELALLPEAEFLAAVRGKGGAQTRFACALRGWPQARIALWEELDALGPEPKPQVLLRVMYRHQDALGADWVRRHSLRLLIQDYPDSLKWLKAAGATPATDAEVDLVEAWAADEEGADPWARLELWDEYAEQVSQARGRRRSADQKLRAALALRRTEQLARVLEGAVPSDDPHDLDRLVAAQLERSLAWDPDDRDTYLRLIRYYRRGRRLKEARRYLDQAMARWPQDMQVLAAALDTALEAGAFKKATGIAREMLSLDPINTDVRERLVEAHLAHARKQVTKGRLDLAHKELDQAGEWARGGHGREQLDLTAGLVLLQEDPEAGVWVLRAQVERLGDGLAARLSLALAADGLDLFAEPLMDRIGVKPISRPTHEDLLATLAKLRTHLDRGGSIGPEPEAYLSKALTKAPWPSLSRGETEAACDTLRRSELNKVRLRVARLALKRWKREPVFELHVFEAKYPHGFDGPNKDVWRLEEALEQAREAGDTRTALRIQGTLDDLMPFGPGPMPFFPPFEEIRPGGPADEPTEQDMIAQLIDTVGFDRALDMLELPTPVKRDLKAMARRQGRDAAVQALLALLSVVSNIIEIERGELGPPPLPLPEPRRPPPRKKRPGKVGKRRGGDDSDAPDDDDQLDLF